MTDYNQNVVWVIFILIGVGTFIIRLSFIALMSKVDEVPEGVRKTLRFVPAAVLTAIIVPALLTADNEILISFGNERLLAGIIAAFVAWKTENVIATIGIGMVSVWVFESIGF